MNTPFSFAINLRRHGEKGKSRHCAAVFRKPYDYSAFLTLLGQAKARHPLKVFAFCLMPNHFHLVLEPAHQIALSEFMQWLLRSHVRRYHRHCGSIGYIWQGRFESGQRVVLKLTCVSNGFHRDITRKFL
jgi:REP element-mobilizing transposase RayT